MELDQGIDVKKYLLGSKDEGRELFKKDIGKSYY
jgi:hypothetical protein